MIDKEVSKQKFDVLMNKEIKLDRCPVCGANGEIVVLMPWYGQTGAKVRCTKCKHSTKIFDIHSHFYCVETKSLGTPILEKSLARGIRAAMQSWNSRSNTEEKGGEGRWQGILI